MKHLTKIFLLGTAVLVAAACQREPLEQQNPAYDPDTQEVVTSFVFNVSTSSTATKQSGAAVQATSTDLFRGISNAALLSYSLDTPGKTLAADATAGKYFDLAAVSSPGSISSSNSRRVLEMSLPLKTNTMLFYGKAPQGDAEAGVTNPYDSYGFMSSYSVGKTAGSANFQIGSRLSDTEYQKFKIVENLFAGIQTLLLNHSIAEGVTISKAATPAGTTTPYGFDVTIPAGGITWKAYSVGTKSPIATEHERYPLEDKLSYLYKQLTTIRSASPTNELRAGSGEATLRMAKDLMSVLNEVRRAEPICDAEAVAKFFANEVYTRMATKYFAPTLSEDGQVVTGVSFQEPSTIGTNFLSDAETAFRPTTWPTAHFFWPTSGDVSSVSDLNPAEFPFNFNIPRGGTHVAFDETSGCFYYPQTFNTSAMGGTPGAGSTFNAQSYFYPAELMYFGNSPIRVSSKDKKTSEYPGLGSGTATGKWENDASWDSDWSGNQVSSSTRAVAMKYDIQYGTAMLATRVRYYEDHPGYLNDNNHAVQKYWNPSLSDTEELDNHVPITATGFKMTGIIIGGQSKAVGWDYLPVKVGSSYQYGFIYDKAIPATAQAIPATGVNETPNYTMVLDNFNAASQTDGIYTAAATQDKVYVAIEFLNNTGVDFYGNGNIIRSGGYFYLIGCLDPAATSGVTDITWPTDRPIPPYKADGTTNPVKRVFIQDFLTSATFTLGANSLHYAYLTVPDLRSSSMSLGLSVDLKWETGLNFADVILGGE